MSEVPKLQHFQQENRSPEMTSFFLYCIKKKSVLYCIKKMTGVVEL